MSNRIYAVRARDTAEVRLVEAPTKQAALRHVSESLFEATVADQHTLIDAVAAGVEVEKIDAAE